MGTSDTPLKNAVEELLADRSATERFRSDPAAFAARHGLTAAELEAVKSGDERALADAGLDLTRSRPRRRFGTAALLTALLVGAVGLTANPASAGTRVGARTQGRTSEARLSIRVDRGRMGIRAHEPLSARTTLGTPGVVLKAPSRIG